jgi:hypothetical protein
MPLVEFEPTNSAGERPQTYASDRAVTGTGITTHYMSQMWSVRLMHSGPIINTLNAQLGSLLNRLACLNFETTETTHLKKYWFQFTVLSGSYELLHIIRGYEIKFFRKRLAQNTDKITNQANN